MNNINLDLLLKNVGDMALKRRAREIILKLDPQKGDKILDIGTGDGYYLYLLSSLDIPLKLTGTDFDPNALKSARRNLNGRGIKLFHGDLMKKLPFKANSFDKIVMSEVAEHLPDDVRGLKEVKRVLKKDGILILTVPNQNYPFVWDPINWTLEHFFGVHIHTGFWSGFWNQHQRLYTPDQITIVLKKAGFKIEFVQSQTWWAIPFNHNLLHFAAKKLYAGDFSPELQKSISKYQISDKRPFLIESTFKIVNIIDKLNEIYTPREGGVGVFIKAVK